MNQRLGRIGIPKELKKESERIERSTSPAALMKELGELVAITIANVIKMALIVRRLEELEHEIELEVGFLPLIRRIAYGQLHPELFVRLQGNPSLLERVGYLPLPDQAKIAENEPMKVMELDGDHRMVPPLAMTNRETKQVLNRTKIRSETEQIGYLRDLQTRQQITHRPEGEILLDRKNGGIIVCGKFISASELANYLSQLTVRKR